MPVTKTPNSWLTGLIVYFNYAILIIFGHFRDFFRSFFPYDNSTFSTKDGYGPLFRSFDNFYQRRLYTKIKDCWNRPIASCATNWIDVMEIVSNDFNKTQKITENRIKCLNLASYNYLGFAENPIHVQKSVLNALDKYGVNTCSSRCEYGTTPLHTELEKRIAKFVGKEDAICVGMGFATNSTGIPSLASKGTLIISDSLNHSSIIFGSKSSHAKIAVFDHNNIKSLEKVIREQIVEGQPRTHRPWKKIIILVEGIYSMEGEICKLKQIVELKKKYKCYLYVDEAHSIGALGPNGKGVCDFLGINPDDVDILMGTFTKSFGSVGGYIASNKKIIDHLRKEGWAQKYCSPLAPVCTQQIISALDVIEGKDGTDIGQKKLKQLHDNCIFFKKELHKMGFEVLGDDYSPVICIMLYHPCKMPGFSRLCLERGLGVVVVGSPATDIIGSRVRFCLSAAHTREDLEFALKVIDDVGDWTMTKYNLQ